jgi:hypothetical protein
LGHPIFALVPADPSPEEPNVFGTPTKTLAYILGITPVEALIFNIFDVFRFRKKKTKH